MKKVLVFQLVLIVSVAIFIGCTSTCSDTGIVGTWQGYDKKVPAMKPLYIFYEDNTCVFQVYGRAVDNECTWTKLKDCQYEAEFTDKDGSIVGNPLLEIDGDTLVEGLEREYKRVN